MSVLGDRLLAVHGALDRVSLPHAFGGAIALAYCTREPRGTRDIDVNVFVAPAEAARVLRALPEGVLVDEPTIATATATGQVRVWWDDTPVDVFLDVHDFHTSAALEVRRVPFAGAEIPVLSCTSLAVLKAMYGRTKDWADLEAMDAAGALDPTALLGWLTRLLGLDHPSTRRLAALLSD